MCVYKSEVLMYWICRRRTVPGRLTQRESHVWNNWANISETVMSCHLIIVQLTVYDQFVHWPTGYKWNRKLKHWLLVPLKMPQNSSCLILTVQMLLMCNSNMETFVKGISLNWVWRLFISTLTNFMQLFSHLCALRSFTVFVKLYLEF